MKNVKFTLLLITLVQLSTLSNYSQQSINVITEYLNQTNIFTDSLYVPSGEIIFSNRIAPYSTALLNYGLHFNNHSTTFMNNSIHERLESDTNCTNFPSCEEPQWYDSPIIGVHGSGTKLVYKGYLKGDNSRCDISLVLTDTGHFVLAKEAYVDLVFSRWTNFTRAIFVYGDGTGTFEIEDGFICDRSAGGTKSDGLGAIRLGNAHFVSNSSAGLPYYYRPKLTDTRAKINSHLVFESLPGSIWTVQTNNQIFAGGFWVYQNMTLETKKNLNLIGEIDTFKYNENYVNYGGMMFLDSNKTIVKSGPAIFRLSGDQAYCKGSKFIVNDGTIEFVTDPFMYGIKSFTQFKTFKTGKYLSVDLNNNAKITATAPMVNLKRLQVNSDQTTVYVRYNSIIAAETATLSGALCLIIPSHINLSPGTIIKVMDFISHTGRFTSISDSTSKYLWDTTLLYTFGELVVIGSTAFNESEYVESVISLFPNPTHDNITLMCTDLSSNNWYNINVFDVSDRLIFSGKIYPQSFLVLPSAAWPSGVYLVKTYDYLSAYASRFIKE